MGKRWTPEEEMQAISLLKQGFSSREVGAKLGRTKEAVAYKNQNKWYIDLSHIEERFKKEAQQLSEKGEGAVKLEFGESPKTAPCTSCGKPSHGGTCIYCKRKQHSVSQSKPCPQCKVREIHTRSNGCNICKSARKKAKETKIEYWKESIKGYKSYLKEKYDRMYISQYMLDWYDGKLEFNRKDECRISQKYYQKRPCMICGYDDLPVRDIHHINEVSKGGDGAFTNLISICPNCHAALHRNILNIEDVKIDFPSKKNLIKFVVDNLYKEFIIVARKHAKKIGIFVDLSDKFVHYKCTLDRKYHI